MVTRAADLPERQTLDLSPFEASMPDEFQRLAGAGIRIDETGFPQNFAFYPLTYYPDVKSKGRYERNTEQYAQDMPLLRSLQRQRRWTALRLRKRWRTWHVCTTIVPLGHGRKCFKIRHKDVKLE